MPNPIFEELEAKLRAVVDAQLALNWTPSALRKSMQASLDSVASLGATMDLVSPSGNASAPSAGQSTDALSLGVGVSASAAASLSLGLSLGIGVSATASLGVQLITDLHATISAVGTLERDLGGFNAEAANQAGTNGVMPPGRKTDAGKVNRSIRGLDEKLAESQSKANAAAAGRPVVPIRAELRCPRIGAWHCELDLDQETIETGKIKFKLDEIEFTGSVVPANTGISGSRARCKIVGGNGRLTRTVGAHSYSGGAGVKVGSVVRDILRECGEDLSDLSDDETLNRTLDRWHTTGGPAQQALTRLADGCGGAWRVMRDGTIWFGTETWPEVEPSGTLVGEDWSDGCLTLASETPDMVPGTVYRDQKIEHVTHRYGNTLRTEIRTTSPNTALAKIFAGRKHEVDYSREWPCKVVTQNPDGTLQLLPDDEIMMARGLDHVPIRYGMPGMKATISNGARCHLAFAAGDPSRPFVCSWEYDPDKVELNTILDGVQSLGRVGDLVQSGGPGTIVTLMPITLVGAPPNNAIAAGMPCMISFSAIPPTPAIATPLFGAIASGIPRMQG